ncbi:glutathione S-transferase 1-like [Oppia nitens]|uniref:glutathione S-transferase 1-like n=1 Tax=Oppia nitens TaxID=1686743 RepID=UPI0023D9F0E0|nr:glutathione S-transferase 1-like [Oppia nitens]
MSIDLYISKYSGPSRAVWMTVKQLKLSVNIKHIDLSEGQQLAPEFVKINPSHTVPTIVDNGFALWESRAILQYLCNQYAPDSSLYPKDTKKRAIVERWLNQDFSLGYHQRDVLYPTLMGAPVAEDKVTAYKNALKVIDGLIGTNKYLTGNDLTIADLSLLAAAVPHDWLPAFDLSDVPNFNRWYNQLKGELSYFDEVNNIPKEQLNAMVEKYKAKFAPKA